MNRKSLFVAAISMFCSFSMHAQFEKDMYTCDAETYSLLSDLSKSQLCNGKIYLFTTTHQDLAWLNNLDACIADRDSLWLTPFLKRLADDSIIVRVYNTTGSEQRVNIACSGRKYQLISTNLIEEEQGAVDAVVLGKYAIETYKLILKYIQKYL